MKIGSKVSVYRCEADCWISIGTGLVTGLTTSFARVHGVTFEEYAFNEWFPIDSSRIRVKLTG